ncbi:MAG: hypothetical protein EPO07_11275 [Verrucomicrobia bacterium]|nr:MAG: hypothetical protein EPO07_11275 [Verrucomicrobiota bacterium]
MKKLLFKLTLLSVAAVFCLAPLAAQSRGYHQSGITGQVTGFPTFITQCHILIIATDGRKFQTVADTDNQLHFDVGLKPGTYSLIPFADAPPGLVIPQGVPVTVRVDKKQFLQFTLVYTPQPE